MSLNLKYSVNKRKKRALYFLKNRWKVIEKFTRKSREGLTKQVQNSSDNVTTGRMANYGKVKKVIIYLFCNK